jgi:hypothetical protein
MNYDIPKLRSEYKRLQKRLAKIPSISHGYVQDRGPGAGGPCYQWTRKESKKTISVALSREQYLAMKEAIGNWRKVQADLKRMQQISRILIFCSMPDTTRRKTLTPRDLGLI